MQEQTSDDTLRSILNAYAKTDEEFWSFRGKAEREHAHVYFQYPAMMVPKMQGQLIADVKRVVSHIEHIFDPFVGSGTTMTEAMMQGLSFTGQDINPLAILICRAKVGPFHESLLQERLQTVINLARTDHNSSLDIDFSGIDKWFTRRIALELAKIRRAIMEEEELWCRRFCWVALAETVRLTSNSRTSTFKLHIRESEDIERRDQYLSPVDIFEDTAKRNLKNFCHQKGFLEEKGFLEASEYKKAVNIRLKDSTKGSNHRERYDLLVTSPPYGDNLTTVPYGQHSFLPLQWINLDDIDEAVNKEWLKTTQEIDRRSLGGVKEKSQEIIEELGQLSVSFKETVLALKKITESEEDAPANSIERITTFYRDLNNCIDPILLTLKPNSYMIWTVGNRRVAGISIPIDQILIELLQLRGAQLVTKIQRRIPTKRMALRNSTASTMGAETILIMKKGES
jgi:hypothetical protein